MFTPIPFSLRYVKPYRKLIIYRTFSVIRFVGVHTNSVFVTFSFCEIRTENEN